MRAHPARHHSHDQRVVPTHDHAMRIVELAPDRALAVLDANLDPDLATATGDAAPAPGPTPAEDGPGHRPGGARTAIERGLRHHTATQRAP